MKIGLRLPQAGEGHATKENNINLAKGSLVWRTIVYFIILR